MASIYANGGKAHHKFTLTVSETGTSREKNTSDVSFQFTIAPVVKGYDWKYWGSSIAYTVTVNGTAFTGTIPDYDGYSTVILKSGSLSVPHNDDGTKSLAFSFAVTDKAGMSYTCGNASAEGTMALTRILRTPPTLSVAVEDSNPVTVALTGNKGTLVRYFSSAAFTFAAEAHDGATIANRTAACGGKTLSGESGVFEKVETGSFTFTATDSYGNSASEPVTLPMIPYIPLTCDLAATRPDAAGNMTVAVSGNCFTGSFGEKENALKVYFRYRESGGSFGDWTEMTADPSGNSYTAEDQLTGLDYQKAYVFQAKAEDMLDTAETAEYTAKAVPVFDWGEEDFNINGALKMNGTPVVDFIVEQGVSGYWTYRKWNSGVAECWGRISSTPADVDSGNNVAVTLPFAFADTGYVVQITKARNGKLVSYQSDSDGAGNVKHSEDSFTLYYAYRYSGIYSVTFNLHVIGEWK